MLKQGPWWPGLAKAIGHTHPLYQVWSSTGVKQRTGSVGEAAMNVVLFDDSDVDEMIAVAKYANKVGG